MSCVIHDKKSPTGVSLVDPLENQNVKYRLFNIEMEENGSQLEMFMLEVHPYYMILIVSY